MTRQQIVEATIATASKEVGVREINGSNRGKRVDEYQRADLFPGLGYSWCASFLAWDMLTTLGKDLCDEVWLRSASCDQILQWGRQRDLVSSTPTKGAHGLVMASKNDATHIFKVEEVLGGAVQTIEGNTNTDGSRNGNGVYRRRRTLSSRYLYVNWAKLIPSGATLPGHPTIPTAVLPKSPFAHCPLFDLRMGNVVIDDALPSLEGRTWVPVWKWAEWTKSTFGWQASTQSVLVDEREVAAQPLLVEGRAWLPVSKLAAHSGLAFGYDAKTHTVTVSRPPLVVVGAK